MYTWHWDIIWHYRGIFAEGALVTLGLALLVSILGTLLGAVVTTVRGSKNPVFAAMARAYVELFRALPTLVVLIWIYYVVPTVVDWRMAPFSAATIALSLHLSAFVSETIRASIESIPQSQFESGLALGMTRNATMLHVILPQAVRTMIPNMLGLYITEMKNSSLTSVIAVNEILHRANILISETFRPLEIYTAVAVMYLVLIAPCIAASRLLEKRFSTGIRSTTLLSA